MTLTMRWKRPVYTAGLASQGYRVDVSSDGSETGIQSREPLFPHLAQLVWLARSAATFPCLRLSPIEPFRSGLRTHRGENPEIPDPHSDPDQRDKDQDAEGNPGGGLKQLKPGEEQHPSGEGRHQGEGYARNKPVSSKTVRSAAGGEWRRETTYRTGRTASATFRQPRGIACVELSPFLRWRCSCSAATRQVHRASRQRQPTRRPLPRTSHRQHLRAFLLT